ncbi:signal transduction histidine kinase [Flavimobilis soli]|uniref:histidine kinase n=1 Tax=Flavimobilis soli TaxID=442709 RepID=A0A2A9EGL0_9MICO|nr:hypothetical protein [Flavimobilis soli]PFG37359.1 signal transduction histidine kinase [Flavimobilis soli]
MDSKRGLAAWIRQSDERQDMWALTASTFAILALFFVVGGFYVATVAGLRDPATLPEAGVRAIANSTVSLVFCVLLWIGGVHRFQGSWRSVVIIVVCAVVASFTRNWAFMIAGVVPQSESELLLAELVAGVAFFASSALLGLRYMISQHRLRAEERQRAYENLQRALALRALEKEEIKVRRSIAEGLHGSLQQRLVILAVRIDQLIETAEREGAPLEFVEQLLELRADLDRTREDDVRAMSRMLYPEGLEIGVVAAVRMLLRRLPTGIATSLEVGDTLREVDEPGSSKINESDRLLIVRVVEEGVTNALRHGHASQFRLKLDLVDGAVLLQLSSNGATVDKARLGAGSVLARIRERLALVGGTVVLSDDLHRPGADLALVHGLHVHLRGVVPLDLDGNQRRLDADEALSVLESWTVRGFLEPDIRDAVASPRSPAEPAGEQQAPARRSQA